MNAAAMLLIWHFTTALLPLAHRPLHGPVKAGPPTLVKCVSHVLNQGKFPEDSLQTRDDEILVQRWEVGRSAVPGVEPFLSPFIL